MDDLGGRGRGLRAGVNGWSGAEVDEWSGGRGVWGWAFLFNLWSLFLAALW